MCFGGVAWEDEEVAGRFWVGVADGDEGWVVRYDNRWGKGGRVLDVDA